MRLEEYLDKLLDDLQNWIYDINEYAKNEREQREFIEIFARRRKIRRDHVAKYFMILLHLKREIRKVEVFLERYEEYVKVFAEDIYNDLKRFNLALIRIAFYILPKLKPEDNKYKFLGWSIDINEDTTKDMKIILDLAKPTIFGILLDTLSLLVTNPKLVIDVSHLSHLRSEGLEEQDIEIILSQTPEGIEYERIFKAKPPFLIIDGCVIELKNPSMQVIENVCRLIEQKRDRSIVGLARSIYKLTVQLLLTAMDMYQYIGQTVTIGREVVDVSMELLKDLKDISRKLRHLVALLGKKLFRKYQNMVREHPEFFFCYPAIMLCLNEIIMANNPISLDFWDITKVVMAVADLLAIADLTMRGFADSLETKDVVYIITSQYCEHCRNFLKNNENKIKNFKKAEIKVIKIGNILGDFEGMNFYAISLAPEVSILITNPEIQGSRVSTADVPFAVWGTQYIPLEETSDIQHILEKGIFERFKDFLEKPKRRVEVGVSRPALRPSISISRPSISAPTITASRPTPVAVLPSRKELGIIAGRLAHEQKATASKIAEYFAERFKIHLKEQAIRNLIKEVWGVGIQELKKMSDEEFQRKLEEISRK